MTVDFSPRCPKRSVVPTRATGPGDRDRVTDEWGALHGPAAEPSAAGLAWPWDAHLLRSWGSPEASDLTSMPFCIVRSPSVDVLRFKGGTENWLDGVCKSGGRILLLWEGRWYCLLRSLQA